jgi:endonuclease YncB( thermonuclease family)
MIVILMLVLSSSEDGRTKVYITNTGKKYHRADCYHASRSGQEITLADAVRQGYGPGDRCHAPVLCTADDLNDDAPAPEPSSRPAFKAVVLECIFGDIVRVQIPQGERPEGFREVEIVHLIGVDTPKPRGPDRPEADPFDAEASRFTESGLVGKEVRLELGLELRDRYGDLLAYIFVRPGRSFNEELIANGLARATTAFPHPHQREFAELEEKAKDLRIGIWSVN